MTVVRFVSVVESALAGRDFFVDSRSLLKGDSTPGGGSAYNTQNTASGGGQTHTGLVWNITLHEVALNNL